MDTRMLKEIIENSMIKGTEVIIKSNDNIHFEAIIISSVFTKIRSKVKQQQEIYNIINRYIKSGEIHAISLKTYSPESWKITDSKLIKISQG